MTNEERRRALNKARAEAYRAALAADLLPDSPNSPALREKARTWAAVAEAMKDGDPVHDAPDGEPVDPFKLQTAASLHPESPTY